MAQLTNEPDNPDNKREQDLAARRANLHMKRTPFSERVVPALLIGLGVLTVALILIALAILLGIVDWQ
ncbi:MAG TPA: hypothetical protein VFR15_01755 [Chloroflexia bacterium]|nr:hypothetical protein [Chloroflexia bacterium]